MTCTRTAGAARAHSHCGRSPRTLALRAQPALGAARTRTGFTLVEMAVVIVIMGLIAALILPGVFRTIERNKLERGRNAVTALKNEVVGYVVVNKQLPENLSPFSGRVDPWGRNVVYYPGILSDINICNQTSTTLRIQKTTTGTTRANIAFVLVSTGKNMHQETGYTSGPPQIVTYYDQGVTDATAFPGYEYDDIVEYVSLFELIGKACP